MPSGIYKIQGSTNRFYIGSAKDFDVRWDGHIFFLREGTHHNRPLQSAWNRGDELTFTICEFCDESILLEREQWWIDQFWDTRLLYNISRTAGRRTGPFSEEHNRKISDRHIRSGHRPPSQRGRKKTLDQIERTASKIRGRRLTETHKQRLRDSHLGKKKSLEDRRRQSERQKGKSRSPHSEESKQRIAEGVRRNWEKRRKNDKF